MDGKHGRSRTQKPAVAVSPADPGLRVAGGYRPAALQMRMPNDGRLYNPSRDLAHCFAPVCRLLAAQLEDGYWRELHEVLPPVSLDELGVACRALLLFVSQQNPARSAESSMPQELAASGWWETVPAARVAAMATLGRILLGMHWAAVRDASFGDQATPASLAQLAELAERFVRTAEEGPPAAHVPPVFPEDEEQSAAEQ